MKKESYFKSKIMSKKDIINSTMKFLWTWTEILGGPIVSVIFLIVTIILDLDPLWVKFIAFLCIGITVPASIIKISNEKNRTRTDFSIIKLELQDKNGRHISPYELSTGDNEFHCVATYADGYIKNYFPVYWTCWQENVFVGPWNVFGANKKDRVVVHHADNHEKYAELTCWLFPPEKERSIPGNKSSSISFKYE